MLLLDTEGDANQCALASFSLAVADAVIVHSPCESPTAAALRDTYESLFATHQPSESRTMLVHIHSGEASDAAQKVVREACTSAWAAASGGVGFDEQFELHQIVLPSARHQGAEYEAVVSELRTKLRSLAADGYSKGLTSSGFVALAADTWGAVSEAAGPSATALSDRYRISTAYQTGFVSAMKKIDRMSKQVAEGKTVANFGSKASALISEAISAFDAGTVDCSAESEEMIERQRERLIKALYNDVRELFSKQHRIISMAAVDSYKAQLLKVNGRAGSVSQYQQDRLRRNVEKSFDLKVASLIVPELNGPTRYELNDAFSKSLTQIATKFMESPAMQLQALGATRRRVNNRKPPRGLQWGLGLVGAARTQWGGGSGNLQSFVGYVDGLNSAHLMVANDGGIADSSGAEPPLFRFQPKLNFDVSI